MKNKKLKFNLQRFASDVVTFLNSQVDPEVMGQMVAAQLPKAIKFSGIAPIDTTLAGQPGSTITLPKFKYSGDAKVVAEGAAIQMDELQTATQTATIKKVAKGMAITDEAVLSGYGDPVGEIQRQIRMAIASAVDNEIVAVAGTAALTVVADVNLNLIDKLENTFVEVLMRSKNKDLLKESFLFHIKMLQLCAKQLVLIGPALQNSEIISLFLVHLVKSLVGQLFVLKKSKTVHQSLLNQVQ